jgi:hypothetical protein
MKLETVYRPFQIENLTSLVISNEYTALKELQRIRANPFQHITNELKL